MSYSLGKRVSDKSGGAKIRDKMTRRLLRKQAMKLSRTRRVVRQVEGGAAVRTEEQRQTVGGKLLLVAEERARDTKGLYDGDGKRKRGSLWGKKSPQKIAERKAGG